VGEEEEIWWESEEDEYVEEEGAFEPEPKEPEERSKFGRNSLRRRGSSFGCLTREVQIRVCVSASAVGVILCNGVLLKRHTIKPIIISMCHWGTRCHTREGQQASGGICTANSIEAFQGQVLKNCAECIQPS
jgi:hypothetical protein